MRKLMSLTIAGMTLVGNAAHACNTDFNITLETFGEGVLVELRTGTPGRSRVVNSIRSFGGYVNFTRLCSGNYFLAIGNEESVSVTPVRNFEDDSVYTSRITMQRGSGNVARRSRASL